MIDNKNMLEGSLRGLQAIKLLRELSECEKDLENTIVSHLQALSFIIKKEKEIKEIKRILQIAVKIINLPKVKLEEDMLEERDLREQLKQALAELDVKEE